MAEKFKRSFRSRSQDEEMSLGTDLDVESGYETELSIPVSSNILERRKDRVDQMTKLYDQIISAIENGKTTEFQMYLEEFRDLDTSRYVAQFLNKALEKENEQIIKIILEAAPDAIQLSYFLGDNEKLNTLFQRSCKYGCRDLVKRLTTMEFDPNIMEAIKNTVDKFNEKQDLRVFKIIEIIVDYYGIDEKNGLELLDTLRACVDTRRVVRFFVDRKLVFGEQLMLEVFVLACETNLFEILPLIPSWSRSKTKMVKGLKQSLTKGHTKVVDAIFQKINGIKRVDIEKSRLQIPTIVQQIQEVYGEYFRKHKSILDEIPYDLITDSRNQYSSKCSVTQLEIGSILSKFSIRSIFQDKAFKEILPCKTCINKNSKHNKRSLIQIFQTWAVKEWSFRRKEHQIPYMTIHEDAIDENNVLVLAFCISFNQTILQQAIKYCLSEENPRARKHSYERKYLMEILSKIFCQGMYTRYSSFADYVRISLTTTRLPTSEIVNHPNYDIPDNFGFDENDVGLKPIAVIVFHGNRSNRLPILDKETDIPIKWKQLTESNDRSTACTEFKRSVREVNVSSTDAKNLFESHSNLNIVTSDIVKKRRHKIIKSKCIVLYCFVKGFIPFGEQAFPREINGIPTDVREGFCIFGAGPFLQIGRGIGVSTNGTVLKSGTAGGFLEKDNQLYILTCAHVLFSERELSTKRAVCVDNISVVSSETSERFGKRKAFIFKHGIHNETSIDASLVKIDCGVSIDDQLPEKDDRKLRKSGFLPHIPPVFNSGEILDIRQSNRQIQSSVVKYGSTTGLTRGSLCLDGLHVRIENVPLLLKEPIRRMLNNQLEPNDRIEFDQENLNSYVFDQTEDMCHGRTFMMFNQVEIDSHVSFGPFLDIGDSGSLVFLPVEDGSLRCIGMAIGCTSYGTCIMTPIVEILRQLNDLIDPENLSDFLRFKRFGGQNQNFVQPQMHSQMSVNSDVSSVSETHSDASTDRAAVSPGQSSAQQPNLSDLFSLISNLGNQMSQMNQSIRTLETKMDSNSTETAGRFQSMEANIETRFRDIEKKIDKDGDGKK